MRRADRTSPLAPGRVRRWMRRHRWASVATIAVLVTVLTGGWVALRGAGAGEHLRTAADLLRRLQGESARADVVAARTTLALLREETAAAVRKTRDPLWRAGQHVPGVGDDLMAVTTVAEALDDLAGNGLPPLIEAIAGFDLAALVPAHGRLDVTGLARIEPSLRVADIVVRRDRDRIAAIDGSGLVSTLRRGVAELQSEIDRAASVVHTAALAAALLPPMLGQQNPRTYLMLFQNLAEPRATGGEMGAFAVLRAHDGRVDIVAQGTATGDLGVFREPVLPLDPSMRQLYTDRLGIFPADINATPHFPTAAALAREMYRLRTGETVDGVLATDPVALSYLLHATGPVQVSSDTVLTETNVVSLLLSDVYARIPSNLEQDRFFGTATRAVFNALAEGRADPTATVASLVRAAAERRLLVWSADPGEEALLAGTVLGGVLPEHDAAAPVVGVFLNDGSGAKLGYHLTRRTEVLAGGCEPDGRRALTVRLTMSLRAPTTGLDEDVAGTGLVVPPYTLRTIVMIFSPAGGMVVTARRDNAPVPLGTGSERGRTVGVLSVDLKPGATTVVETTLLTDIAPADAVGEFTPILWTTPGVTSGPEAASPTSFCPRRR